MRILSSSKLRAPVKRRVVFDSTNREKPRRLFNFFLASGCSFAAVVIAGPERLPSRILGRTASFGYQLGQTHHIQSVYIILAFLHRRTLSRNNNGTVLGIENGSDSRVATQLLSWKSFTTNLVSGGWEGKSRHLQARMLCVTIGEHLFLVGKATTRARGSG